MPVSVIENASFGNNSIVTANGIKFPATQVASADANTLDDYEEGTFTPTVAFGYTSPTYGAQAGRYTKIGRICYFSFRLTVVSGTRNSNLLRMTLPFSTPIIPALQAGAAYWAYASGSVINSTSTNLPVMYISGDGTNIVGFYNTSGTDFNGTSLSADNIDVYITGWMECA